MLLLVFGRAVGHGAAAHTRTRKLGLDAASVRGAAQAQQRRGLAAVFQQGGGEAAGDGLFGLAQLPRALLGGGSLPDKRLEARLDRGHAGAHAAVGGGRGIEQVLLGGRQHERVGEGQREGKGGGSDQANRVLELLDLLNDLLR